MPHGDDAIQALRAALAVSPANLPLRLHLIRSLAGYGRFEIDYADIRAHTLELIQCHAPDIGWSRRSRNRSVRLLRQTDVVSG